jgi:hypothetical protein
MDFTVLPNKRQLVDATVALACQRLQTPSAPEQVQALVEGAVALLWGHVEGLHPELVLAHLTDAQKLQAALSTFQDHANHIAAWSDQFRGSPDGAVQDTQLPFVRT